MSLLNTILGQVSENATVQNLAAKVGLSPEQAEQAIAALGQAHTQPGDTVETASQNTGIQPTSYRRLCSTLVARDRWGNCVASRRARRGGVAAWRSEELPLTRRRRLKL